MLSIGSLRAGSGHYYTQLAREDYYLEGGEPPGQWTGGAAQTLGFMGTVGKEALQAALQGFSLDGRKLVQNAGKDSGPRRRQAGLDLTFSADKSVSVLWALGGEETRHAIESAHERSVNVALRYLEQEAAWTRRGKGGEDFERCELLFSKFQHSTSRAQEMKLHTHVLCPNVGLRSDGSTAALWNNELYQHKMAAGAIYRVALAYELGPRGLGLPIEPHQDRPEFFRLQDVPKAVCDFFSSRRRQIERELQEKGTSSSRAADAANLATRQVKGHVARAELQPRWSEQAKDLGYEPRPLPEKNSALSGRTPLDISALAYELTDELASKQSTFRRQDLVRAVAERSLDGLTDPRDLLRVAEQEMEGSRVQAVHHGKRHPVFTTRDRLASEQSLLRMAAILGEKPGLVVSSALAQVVKNRNETALSTKERDDAFDYLVSDPGNLKVLAGAAGTGKTSLLKTAREAWEKAGYRVVGMALAGKASRELKQGAGIETETVRKRQLQLEPTLKEQCERHGRELRRAARWGQAPGYESSSMDRLKLDSKTVVVIDESSMLGLEDTSQMLRLAMEAGAKVVMVGDEKQLPSIEAVSPFEALGQQVGRFELRDIKRQTKPWMQEAVRAFAQGDVRTGLSLLMDNGCLHMGRGGPEETKKQLISDWLEAQSGARTVTLAESLLPDSLAPQVQTLDALILTATNEDAHELNALAQQARKKAGHLGTITVTLGSGETAARGDQILFGQNDRRLGIWNGDLGTVVKIHRPVNANPFDKGEVTVELGNGDRVRVNLNQYADTSLGYALTTHKAQGSTVDEAFVYTNPQHVSREMVYVQTSRARNHLAVYCPGHDLGEDLAELERAVERESRHELAIEVQSRDEAARLENEHELPRAADLSQEDEERRRQAEGLGLERGL